MNQPERRPRPRTRAAAPRLTAELKLAVAAALDKKAEHLVVLDLRKSSAFTDHFLICTGANVRQVQAISEAVQDALRKAGVRPALVEGTTRSEWVLIDYFDFIVDIFTPGSREFYALERLWGDAEPVPIPGMLA